MGLEQLQVGFDDTLGQRVGITRSGTIEGLRELLICRPGPFCKGPGIYSRNTPTLFLRYTNNYLLQNYVGLLFVIHNNSGMNECGNTQLLSELLNVKVSGMILSPTITKKTFKMIYAFKEKAECLFRINTQQ